jgi:uncharacterized protein
MDSDSSRAGRRLHSLRDVDSREAARAAEGRIAPGAPVHDTRFPGWERAGEFLYRRRQRFPGGGVALWPHRLSHPAQSPEELVFYDTETTGLSGGAGSVIFLFGTARCEGADLVVEQLFLSDFPGEPDFLHAVRGMLAPFTAFVSYNGATFDSHLLRTRFLMNRIEWEPGPQLDLLHHARRLWKSITGDCSLHTIESSILGVTRELDVDGSEIPLIWLDFLRTGLPGMLPVVFDHNATDITTLARMYGVLGRLFSGDVSSAPVDERALGRWLVGHDPSRGTGILRGAFDRGNPDAGIALGLHHKRLREWDAAAALWESVMAGTRSVVAGVELAKHLEHRAHAMGRALEVVERILSWNLPLDTATRRDLVKRRDRLARKIESQLARRTPGSDVSS